MAVDIIARGMAGNGGSGGVDQSYVDAQDRKTLNDAKSYTNETAIDYIGREQQIDFNATLEGNIITATLDETVSDFTFTNNTGYLFHIYLPLVTLTGTLDNSYEIILKDKDNNTININCMFQKDITKTSTVGDLCQIQDYDTGIGYSWEFYGNYREITENGTLIREVYTDTVVRETNPSMTGQDLHLAIVNNKLKVGTVVMCTTNYENNGSAYYAGRTYKINGDYSTGELILSAEDITVNTFGDISVENVVSRNLLTLGHSVKTSNGLTTIASGSSITINGTTTSNWANLNDYIDDFNIEAGDYCFSINANLKAMYVIYFKYEDGTEHSIGLNTNSDNSLKITFAQKVHSIRMVIDGLTSGTTISNEVVNFQLEEGSTSTPYKTYLNMQELQEKSNDTGWIDLSSCINTTYFAAREGQPPMARKINGIVYWKGMVYCHTDVGNTNAEILNNLPDWVIPIYENSRGSVQFLTNIPYNIFLDAGNGKIIITQGQNIVNAGSDHTKAYALTNLSSYPID